jgi:hypothetical protein
MPIYNINEKREVQEVVEQEVLPSKKERVFSSFAARVFFFLLLLWDVCWGFYSLVLLLFFAVINVLTFGRMAFFCKRRWTALKRSGICAISLFLALFSPSLGIMIACTYFLMHDKDGIEEVVPRSLQEQFEELAK